MSEHSGAIGNLRKAAYVSIGAMIILLIGSFLFYRERMLFLDASFISFIRINVPELESGERRYGAFITQVIPLIGAYLHLPLKVVLLTYSLSFNLFYLAVVILLVRRYRQYALAILMAIYYTLFVSDSYFWTNNEIHQGIAWLFLFFAVTFRLAQKKVSPGIQIPVFILLGALALFTHPLVGVSAFFLWGFLWIDGRYWPFTRSISILYTLLLCAIIAGKVALCTEQGYDGAKVHNALHTTLKDIIDAMGKPMARTFYGDVLTNYWCALIILIIGLVALIREKKYALLWWTIGGITGYIVLMGITFEYAYDYHGRFYMESEWQTLSIPVAAAFVFYGIPRLPGKIAVTGLVLIFMVRFFYIGQSSAFFTNRVDTLHQGLANLKKKGITKAYIVHNKKLDDLFLLSWGLPVETLMLSALNGDNPRLTIASGPEEEFKNRIPQEHHKFSGDFFVQYPHQEINRQYFNFDTTQGYTMVAMEDIFD